MPSDASTNADLTQYVMTFLTTLVMVKQPRLAAGPGRPAGLAAQNKLLLLVLLLLLLLLVPCRVELHAEYVHHLFSP